MAGRAQKSNIELVDILLAVALGEGFFAGIYEFKERILSGEILTLGADGQSFARVLLSFLVIILSWMHYRSSAGGRHYPTAELVADILVALAYMVLFLFVETPVAYYAALAVIWTFYALARIAYYRGEYGYLAFGLTFAGLFAVLALSVSAFEGAGWQWLQLMLATLVAVGYRPLDRMMRQKLPNPDAVGRTI